MSSEREEIPLVLPPWYDWSQKQSDCIKNAAAYIMQWVIDMPDNDFSFIVLSWWRHRVAQAKLPTTMASHNSRYNISSVKWQSQAKAQVFGMEADELAADQMGKAKQK